MVITKFEDIRGWQAARDLTKVLYDWISEGKFGNDFGLRDQTQRASVSIMANISEQFDSGSSAEFIRFLTYARRSASETQSHLYVALDQNYLSEEEFHRAYKLAAYTKDLIGGFIRYLAEKDIEQKHRSTEAQEY